MYFLTCFANLLCDKIFNKQCIAETRAGTSKYVSNLAKIINWSLGQCTSFLGFQFKNRRHIATVVIHQPCLTFSACCKSSPRSFGGKEALLLLFLADEQIEPILSINITSLWLVVFVVVFAVVVVRSCRCWQKSRYNPSCQSKFPIYHLLWQWFNVPGFWGGDDWNHCQFLITQTVTFYAPKALLEKVHITAFLTKSLFHIITSHILVCKMKAMLTCGRRLQVAVT